MKKRWVKKREPRYRALNGGRLCCSNFCPHPKGHKGAASWRTRLALFFRQRRIWATGGDPAVLSVYHCFFIEYMLFSPGSKGPPIICAPEHLQDQAPGEEQGGSFWVVEL